MADNSRILLDVQRTCRTCLSQKSTDELRSVLENNLNLTINEVANVELSLSSSLPTNICIECIRHLNIALNFQKQVQNSESQLRNLIFEEESDHMTVIYKSFTVLDNTVISEDCVTNIEEIIGPRSDFKDNILIVENIESDIQNDEGGKTATHFFKDGENIYTIAKEIADDNSESVDYYVTNEDDMISNISSESEAVNLTKNIVVLNTAQTNVIKWADSETNNPTSVNSDFIQEEQKVKDGKNVVLDIPELKASMEILQENHCSEAKIALDIADDVKPEKIINYRCELCSKTFRYEFIYRKHLLKHGISISCEHCTLTFKDTNLYFYHVRKYHPDFKPYACPSCDERFFTLTPLKSHFKKQHLIGRPTKFECNLCGRTFFQHNALTNHKKSHTGPIPYKCDICNKKLSNAHSLRNHLKIHKGEKNHRCDVCGATFIHGFSMRAHWRIHTGERPFACKLCDSKFTSSSYLKIHIRTHTDEKPYACIACPKRFVSRCALAAHEKAHTGERKFVCDVCGWRSSRSADLQTHIRKHTGERPYNCEQCGKTYRTASNLSAHRRTHTGLKEHVCKICNKAFGDPRTLKGHIRIHTGEKPYQCHVCGLRFKQSGRLSAHRKIHQTSNAGTSNT